MFTELLKLMILIFIWIRKQLLSMAIGNHIHLNKTKNETE